MAKKKSLILTNDIHWYTRHHKIDKRLKKDFEDLQKCLGHAQGSLDHALLALTAGKSSKASGKVSDALAWLDDVANLTKLIGVDAMIDKTTAFVQDGYILELLDELRDVDQKTISAHTKKVLDTMAGFTAQRLEERRASEKKHRYDNWTGPRKPKN